ncbi:MAG: tetratricopeptide repeat protein [Candidatus Omnitrophota bacterium]
MKNGIKARGSGDGKIARAPGRGRSLSLKPVSAGFCVLLILCAGLLVYSNTFDCSFQFDDELSITRNLSLRQPHLAGIWRFWPGRFLTYLSLAWNYSLGKERVFGYHVFNLLVHIGCGLLIFTMVRLLAGTPALRSKRIREAAPGLALFSGLVFVVHPAQTQAVTYVIQRAAELAALGCLSSGVLYLIARLKEEEGGSWRFWRAASVAAAFFSMFTKENAVILPALLGLLEYVFFKPNRRRLLPFVAVSLVIPAVMMVSGSVDLAGLRRVGEPQGHLPVSSYFLTQLRVVITYMRLALFPVRQSLDYDYPVYASLQAGPAAGLVLVLGLTALVWKTRRNTPLVTFGALWFLIALLPESGLVPIRDVIFEHRMYLPMAGFAVLFPALLWQVLRKAPSWLLPACALAVIAAWSVMAYQRNRVWKDPMTLWNDVLAKAPGKARAYKARGFEYEKQGDFGRALKDYQTALSLDPAYDQAYLSRGNILVARGEYRQALADYDAAIALNPDYAQAYHNRAVLSALRKDYGGALNDFSEALRIQPDYAEAYRNRALVFLSMGRKEDASSDFRQAVRLDPADAASFYGLAMILADLKQWEAAWRELGKATALGFQADPDIIRRVSSAAGGSDAPVLQ